MAPPYLGAVQTIRDIICGIKQYRPIPEIGLDVKTDKEGIFTFSSLLALLPIPVVSKVAKEDWFQLIKKRIAYEKGQSNNPVFDFLPKRDDTCYTSYDS